jgi:hypothetical protein
MPPNTVKVDRTTMFGNPFPAEQQGHSGSVRMYRLWIEGKLPKGAISDRAMKLLATRRELALAALPSLKGKNLACWCQLPKAGEPDVCHAAVLLEIVRQLPHR